MTVITRFAPSPTGYFHAGSYRTALFSWIFARQNKGKFILRIEDTDKERSKREYEENIIDSLKWLGLEYDEFFRQSDRIEVYKKYIQRLIVDGYAYVSDETSKNEEVKKRFAVEGKKIETNQLRASVIRFKNPNKKISFNDTIRGMVEFDTTELGDFIIAKSENEPVFHLVVVIDDHEMGITHIIRGEDHISNTSRQILIFEAIGAKIPQYVHIPLLLSSDHSKLSKRHGAISVSEYRNKGYLPEAMVNYLALLGWHPSDDKEILTIEEIMDKFSLERVQKSGAIFDEEKLKWFNRQYVLKLSDTDFAEHARPFLPEWVVPNSDTFNKLIPVLRDKITKFSEITAMLGTSGELAFVRRLPEYEKQSLLWKKNPDPRNAQTHLIETGNLFKLISVDSFMANVIKQTIWPYVEANGKGDVLWPLRMALTGQEQSPDPFISAALLGKEESLKRLYEALSRLRN
ncbi:MAG: glutamate--tRNA ligase [Candidatus Taylorbacteria bacterium RIFCSPLOWO2_01_FULL_45_59]|nr:MAG: glutamate--tRNA ligase [Candidatus Taylorbacteria bacterium RIFCSPLOWO2_01_FULL_45_59]OHA44478.1 MAG: glutamate--tRNA ligase [Candidatus Taylorbacteria bacterium RIFCSPLOWO2_12_FULL_44_9]